MKVMIVDDDRLFLEGAEHVLRRAGHDTTGFTELPPVRELPPFDVALIDMRLRKQSGVEVIAALRRRYSRRPLAALTAWSNDDLLFNALSAGASGYLLKSDPIARLAERVRELADGEVPMSAEIARRVLKTLVAPNTPPVTALSQRESEVLELASRGLRRPEVARLMKISEETVKTLSTRIFRKLHVDSMTGAVAVGLRSRMLQ